MSNNVFQATNIRYAFDEANLALDGVSLSIAAGEKLAILGPNGSGKSTFLAMLDGLVFPHSGELLAFDQPLTEAAFQDEQFAVSFRKRVGLVFQEPDTQLFSSTVWDEIAFGPAQLALAASQVKERVEFVLDLMRLTHLKERSPYRLSSGEKKRVAIAAVLAIEPEVLLLDEPTAGLDPRSQYELVEFLLSWHEFGKTIVMSTHDLDILQEIAQRVIVLDEKHTLAAEGTPAEILNNQDLLRRTNLIHQHPHHHGAAATHVHPHTPLEHHQHTHNGGGNP